MVTNIDPEHLDHFAENFDAVKRAFQGFVESIPFYGFAAICIDDPDVQEMAAKVENRRLITYGVNPQAEVRAMNIGIGAEGSTFDVLISGADGGSTTLLGDIKLPMAGQHNVQNALAAIAIGRELGAWRRRSVRVWPASAASDGVSPSPARRAGVKVVDDYGHHPVEISNVLKAARAVTNGRVIAVVQPHQAQPAATTCSRTSAAASTTRTW